MGFLTPDDYKNAIKNTPKPATPQTQTAVQEQPKQSGQTGVFGQTNDPVTQYIQGFSQKAAPLSVPGTTPIQKNVANPISDQAQINRFGGKVGSPEYYNYKAEHPYQSFLPQQIMSGVGMEFPDQETWDTMSRGEQVGHIGGQSIGTVFKLIFGLPKAAATSVVRYGYSVAKPWSDLAQGKLNWDDLKKSEVTLPWVGTVPSYWKTFGEKQETFGNLGGALAAGSDALADVTLIPSLVEASAAALRPKGGTIAEGAKITATKPIENAILKENEALAAKRGNPDNPAEYYDLPKNIAKNYDGNASNIKLKVTPAGDGQVELSVVKLQSGLDNVKNWITNKAGRTSQVVPGKFGNEIKLESQIIETTPKTEVANPGIKEVTIGVDKMPLAEYNKFVDENYKTIVDNGGITVNLAGEKPTKGYAYSPFKDTEFVIEKEKFTPDMLGEYISKHQEKLTQPGYHVGAWEDNGKVYLDISKVGEPVPQTIAEAEAADQLAVFDLEKFESIYTKHGQRANSLKELEPMVGQYSNYNGFKDALYEDPQKAAMFTELFKNEKELKKFYEDVKKANSTNLGGGQVQGTGPQGADGSVEPFPSGQGASLSTEETAEALKQIAAIPPKPLKGMEKNPITSKELGNLDLIGKVNNIPSSIKEAVIRTLTGKNVVGDLTHAEYVNVAQTLSKLSNASKYAPDYLPSTLNRYASPARYWMRNVEQKTGIPVYSRGYMAMEEAMRLAKVSEQTQLGALFEDELIKKYMSPKYAEERRLVRAYREGDKAAITKNSSLSPETKAELIKAAGIFDDFYRTIAPDVGIDPEIFLDQYSPHISDIGGKFQLYKKTSDMPSGAGFFAKEKRHGSLASLIDDEWALAEIYARAGYKSKYLDPVLKDINAFSDRLPVTVKDDFKSYIQEKLGYAGEMERWMDNTALKLNKAMGWNLPPDIARQVTNQAMNTMYSSAMSQPATMLRNGFQYPIMGYAQLGPRFAGEAITKAFTKAGREEFLRSGFAVDLGVPFGEELARQSNLGGYVGNAYRNVTQGVLKPNSFAETSNRAIVYHQSKMLFEDAISKYNAGKIGWEQVEKELDFAGMNPLDRNLIRQDLTSGNLKGAMEKYIQNMIDDTQFPYRRGAEMRLSYGMTGHLGTSFMQWPVEYAHTLSKWVRTGQWDKIIRWYAATSLIVRTFQQEAGWDFSKSFGLNPLIGISPAPVVNVMQNFVAGASNWLNQNEEAFNENKDEIVKQLRLTYPAGVEIANLKNFYKSYNAGPVGPNGTYPVYDIGGRLKYYGTFRDIFWQAFGMPTNEKMRTNELQKEMTNAKFDYNQAKAQIMKYYQEEQYDKAAELIEQYGIMISPSDFDKYYIPLTQRTYNALPAMLKAQFAPEVYPSE